MAEEGSIRQTRAELRRTRQRAPVSNTPNPLIPPPRRIIPEQPKPPQQIGARRAEDVGSKVRDRLQSRNRAPINLPAATAVGLNAQRQAERGYEEGLGISDAYQAGVGEGGETASQAVMPTFMQTYGAEDEEQSEFAGQMAQMKASQEQFLPGSTGLPSTEFQGAERNRPQQRRPTGLQQTPESFGGGNFGAAAALATQRAALQEQEQEEEAEAEGEGGIASKAEGVQRAYVVGMDFLGATEALVFAESVIGAIPGFVEVVASMNTRLLVWGLKIKKGSLIRKIEPPAQYPFEVFTIITADIMLAMLAFAAIALLVGIAFVVMSLVSAIPGMPSIPGLPGIVSNGPPTT